MASTPLDFDSSLTPDRKLVERFERSLDQLVPKGEPIGVAVSGGPDSLALLLLAHAARPGEIKAATVDHDLRDNSEDEAAMVAGLCAKLDIPHTTLTVEWDRRPTSAIQERARLHRYRHLGEWAKAEGIKALVTAHHREDQAETLIMRLRRGSGVRGLASMRRKVTVPGGTGALVRPLLGWSRDELASLVQDAGLEPVDDPTNSDDRFERARVRKIVGESSWMDARSLAQSASNLADADAALIWAAKRVWQRTVKRTDDGVSFAAADIPREFRRRIIGRIVRLLGTEGRGADLRGREADRLLAVLASGKAATVRGVLCKGGPVWTFSRAPSRQRSGTPAPAKANSNAKAEVRAEPAEADQ